MHANILVLHHDARRLRQRRRHVQRLRRIRGGRRQSRTQIRLRAILRDGEAIHRTDVDAGIALDAELRGKDRLHVAIEAALHFERRFFRGESQLDFDVDFLEAIHQSHMRYEAALNAVVFVLVRPFVHAHLAARQGHAPRQALVDRFVVAELMNGNRGLVAMLNRPDDVLWAEGRIAAEKHLRQGRLEGGRVDLGNIPFVELDADALLDPRKSIFLSDGKNDVIAGKEHIAQRTRRLDVAVLDVVFQFLEHHAGELAALDDEGLRRVIDDDFDFFSLGVFEFPLGSLEELTRLARHDLDVFGAEPERAAAAIHGGIADADDQNPLADLVDVTEGDRFEPGDADVNAVGIVAAGQFEFLALGRTRADEYRVEFFSLEQPLHALDG